MHYCTVHRFNEYISYDTVEFPFCQSPPFPVANLWYTVASQYNVAMFSGHIQEVFFLPTPHYMFPVLSRQYCSNNCFNRRYYQLGVGRASVHNTCINVHVCDSQCSIQQLYFKKDIKMINRHRFQSEVSLRNISNNNACVYRWLILNQVCIF